MNWNPRSGALLVLLVLLALLAAPARTLAQAVFPLRPVKIIMPQSPGTGADTVARQLAEKLSAKWKQPVVVENRPGANGFPAMQALKQLPADGYALVAADPGILAITPRLLKKLPYDSKADFIGVAGMFRTYYMMVTSASGNIDSYAKLIAAAKSGQVTYASTGVGSPAHLGGAVLSERTQVPMVHVAYKDASQMFTDLSSGNTTWAWATVGSIRPLLDSRRVRLLAAGAPQRQAGFEDVPTLGELGGPKDLTVDTWRGLLALKGTPPEIVHIINRDVNEAMRSPELKKSLAALGFDELAGSPADLDGLIDRDIERYGLAVKGANIESQ